MNQSPFQLSCGYQHSLVLSTDLTVFGFGANTYYGLGFPTNVSQLSPSLIPNIGSKFIRISAFQHHSIIVSNESIAYTFGSNDFGELGQSDYTTRKDPSPLLAFGKTSSLVEKGSGSHSILIKNGRSYASGQNTVGQLGLGDFVNRKTPTLLSHLSNVDKLSLGSLHSLFLVSNGTVYSTGDNQWGQLGLGDANTRNIPTRITFSPRVLQISAGLSFSLILTNQSDLYAFGKNDLYQLGVNDTLNRLTPTYVSSNVQFMSAGSLHSLLLMNDGSLFGFGTNSMGQLGIGYSPVIFPTQVFGFPQITRISAGNTHSLVLDVNRRVWSFGSNTWGELGLGDTVARSTPTMIPEIIHGVEVSAGALHSLFLEASICYGILSIDPMVCSGNGGCFSNHECICNYGWVGLQCDIPVCTARNSTEFNVCNGRGNCTTPDNCTDCCCDYTGNDCQYPICWGVPSNNPTTCTSQGDCILPNNCSCFNQFFYGEQCQYNHFHWKPQSGTWSNKGNWYINNNGTLVNAHRIPYYGDTVYIDQPGSYSIIMDLPSYNFSFFRIGGPTIQSTLVVVNSNIFVNGTFDLLVNSTLRLNSTSLNIFGEQNVTGTLDLTGSASIVFNSHVNYTGSLKYTSTDRITFGSTVLLTGNNNINDINVKFTTLSTIGGTCVFELRSGTVYQHPMYFQDSAQIHVYSNTTFPYGITTFSSNTIIAMGGVLNLLGSTVLNSNVFGDGFFILGPNSILNIHSDLVISPKVVSFGIWNIATNVNFTSNVNFTNVIVNGDKSIQFQGKVQFSGQSTVNPLVMTWNFTKFIGGTHSFKNLISTAYLEISDESTLLVERAFTCNYDSMSGGGSLNLTDTCVTKWNGKNLIINVQLNSRGSLTIEANQITQFQNIYLEGVSKISCINGFIASPQIVSTGTTTIVSNAMTVSQLLVLNGKTTISSPTIEISNDLIGQGEIVISSPKNVLSAIQTMTIQRLRLFSTSTIAFTTPQFVVNFKESARVDANPMSFIGIGTFIIESSCTFSIGGIFEFHEISVQNFGRISSDPFSMVGIDTIKVNSAGDALMGQLYIHKEMDWIAGRVVNAEISMTSQSILSIYDSKSKSLSNSNIFMDGKKTTFATESVVTLYSSTMTLEHESTLLGQIFGDSTSSINNNGNLLIDSTIQNIGVLSPILNGGKILIIGQQNTTFSAQFAALPYSTLNLRSTTLIVDGTLHINNGNLISFSSRLVTNLLLTSSTGISQILGSLSIIGNANLTATSTMVVRSNGFEKNDMLIVIGRLDMTALLFIKIGLDYTPLIRDQLAFFMFGTSLLDPLIIVVGAPYRNGRMLSNSLVEIIFSFGAPSNTGYSCHYLGNQKILEMNDFQVQNQMNLAFTLPKVYTWFGFGLLFNNSLEDSLFFVVSNNQVYQVKGHNQTITQDYENVIDVNSNLGISVFGLGDLYATVNILVTKNILIPQNRIVFVTGAQQNLSLKSPDLHQMGEIFHYSILRDRKVDCTNFLQPARAEVFSFAGTGITLVIYAVFFVLCCCFFPFEPMKSRGISPFLTLFFLFAQMLMEIRNAFYITPFQGSLCVYYALGYYPLAQICFVMIFIYFLRYFSIINLNHNKLSVFQNNVLGKSIDKALKWKIKFLKFTSRAWITIGLIFVSYIIVVVIFIICLIPNDFECRFENITAIKMVHNILLIGIYSLTILAFLIDMCSNWEMLKACRWIDYIFRSDPFYFRIQIVLFIPFMIYSLISELYTLFTTLTYVDVIENYRATMIFNTISTILLLMIDVLFPLIITIISVIIKIFKKPTRVDLLNDTIIKDRPVFELFWQFCASEFSIENISAYLDIYNWKNTTPVNDRLKNAQDIFDKYLNGDDSPMELNIAKRICIDIKQNIHNKAITDHLFLEAENTLRTNLSDTYGRFCTCPEYTTYLMSKKTKLELIEGSLNLYRIVTID